MLPDHLELMPIKETKIEKEVMVVSVVKIDFKEINKEKEENNLM